MKKLTIVILLATVFSIFHIFSFSLVSAYFPSNEGSYYDYFSQRVANSQEDLIVSEEQCNSFKHKLYASLLNGFVFKVSITEPAEVIYLVIGVDDCEWDLQVLKDYNGREDMLITLKPDPEDFEVLDEPPILKSRSLKGFFLQGIAKEYINAY